jgi:acyl-CoA synthetase (AMP-forming)/AMP-acid ligase II
MRALGLAPGDRVVCALSPGPAFVMLLVAALWEELTFVPVPAAADLDRLTSELHPALVVAERPAVGVACPDPAGAPPGVLPRAGDAAPPTRDARFLLQTSGTTGAARWIALSDANVHAVLASHRAQLGLGGAVLLSVLPWHHAFGLVLELLPALLDGAELLRVPSGGRDVNALLAVAASHPVTHLHTVPHTARLLAERADGRALLERLTGGLIGGAPISGELAAALARTRLRVGYGQTEAAPGITIGAPGEWRAGLLGRPLGCDVRIDADGVLAFRGPNACLGEWRAGTLTRLPADRWVRTGDLARCEADGSYTYEGRLAHCFKLANGRHVPAAAIERAVIARFPTVQDALLSSPDGETLLLACSTTDGGVPNAGSVVPLLGALAERPLRVLGVAPEAWVRTPKGELDRRFPVGRDR